MPSTLRLLATLSLASLLAACASQPKSTLGQLPQLPEQASVDQLLLEASSQNGESADLLRLSAADLALQQNDPSRASQVLDLVNIDQLKPAQQVFALTLEAEAALARKRPRSALRALEHPSMMYLAELPLAQQERTQLARVVALEANDQTLKALRERLYLAPLLQGQAAFYNHQAIWALASQLPSDTLRSGAPSEIDLDGWMKLALIVRESSSAELLQQNVQAWRSDYPQHPAAAELPSKLEQLLSSAGQPLQHIALLLPAEGELAGVGRALRDGFMAARLQSVQQGADTPEITLYDSSRLTSLDDFYQQAAAAGAQLVIGPLDKQQVSELARRTELPIPTLALNYAEGTSSAPAQMFQFGLAAEDEARSAAQQAWADGHRRAIAMVPNSAWGRRVAGAFEQAWTSMSGQLLATSHVDQPVELANQIAEFLDLRSSEQRTKRLAATLGKDLNAVPTRRQDVDFVFLAASPIQARQIKPTLTFQYAGDLPVYATSHVNSGFSAQEIKDMNGIRFCETPWLLDQEDALRQQLASTWPQATGSLGRLYAMGIDAYRLAPRLNQLLLMPDAPVDGETGRLSLTSERRIQRSLPWAEFTDGQVRTLD
ncbi:penicillin-binding protein activator [Atopomonas sediminilitoris]|uniref:penicillin-binding protein activator n=1 Tax=Atopomonas sediminilitoris TaxID=2919919 RepID=UPI001F4E65C5|nr:penicillin-binding protein activator [Atopomonas sediminilitoris]MCJ8170684.1 penicillin-binding protein activator [Atopomonas sediminilitoris]